jgi:hypothetical protein
MAMYADLYADQGSYFSAVIPAKSQGIFPIDLSLYDLRGKIKKSYNSDFWIDFSVYAGDNPSLGNITISLESDVTAGMKPGRYVYDIEITQLNNGWPIGKVTRIAEGQIQIAAGATHSFNLEDIEPPVFGGWRRGISGSHSVGANIIRPDAVWFSKVAYSVTGEWVKNGILTGNSSVIYSNTAEGDLITWQSRATNILGQSTTVVNPLQDVPFLVSNKLSILTDGINSETYSLIQGLSGGSQNMKVFSVDDHVNSIYQYNQNMWAYNLRHQLSARVVVKNWLPTHQNLNDSRPEDYGGVLITPRHVLYCKHAHPHAANTWPPSLADDRPCFVRFVLADGTPVDAVQISQFEATDVDLCIATLDRDVAQLGVSVMPLNPYNGNFLRTVQLAGGIGEQWISSETLPFFSVSQGYAPGQGLPWTQPASDYPYPDHGVLCYIIDIFNEKYTPTSPTPQVTTYLNFNYSVYDGDSGSPTFFLYDGTVYLYQILSGIWTGPDVSNHIPLLNELIQQSDNYAIQLGRLGAPTGLTVDKAPDPIAV